MTETKTENRNKYLENLWSRNKAKEIALKRSLEFNKFITSADELVVIAIAETFYEFLTDHLEDISGN